MSTFRCLYVMLTLSAPSALYAVRTCDVDICAHGDNNLTVSVSYDGSNFNQLGAMSNHYTSLYVTLTNVTSPTILHFYVDDHDVGGPALLSFVDMECDDGYERTFFTGSNISALPFYIFWSQSGNTEITNSFAPPDNNGWCNDAYHVDNGINADNVIYELDLFMDFDDNSTDLPTTTTTPPSQAPIKSPSVEPTTNPTADPIVDPTRDPTGDPIADPTTDPTITPTTIGSASPTDSPTVAPSREATTIEPTVNPITTFQPSFDSNSDTASPTTSASPFPTTLPLFNDSLTDNPTTMPSSIDKEADTAEIDNVANTQSVLIYKFIVGLVLCFLAITIIISCVDARCIAGRRNDFYSAGTLIAAMFQIMDLISDIFFSVEMWIVDVKVMFIASAAFIVVPVLLSLLQLFLAVQQWRCLGKDTLTAWIRKYAFGLYALSLVTGSAFSGIQICRSDIFGLPQFAMPLNENQIVGFQSKKLWTTVMLEVE